MQTMRRAAVVFCVACIGAELVTSLAGSARPARCIKAVAGLYILAVLFSQLPDLPDALRILRPQSIAGVSSIPAATQESLEEQLLTWTKEQLERSCAEQCFRKFGTRIQVTLALESDGQGVAVTQAVVTFRAEDILHRQEVLTYLQQELGIVPTEAEETTP